VTVQFDSGVGAGPPCGHVGWGPAQAEPRPSGRPL